LGMASVDFDVVDQLPVIYSEFFRHWIKNGIIMGQYVSYRFREGP